MTEHRPPSARRLLADFLVFAALLALAVFVAVFVLLVRVRSGAEREVDQLLSDKIEEQLRLSASQQARVVQSDLSAVADGTTFLRDKTKQAFEAKVPAADDEVKRYRMLPSGAYATTDADDKRVSMLYTYAADIGADEMAKASYTAAIDPVLQNLVGANPLIAQAYLNTSDGMTRIFPGFDIADIDTGTLPSEFSFYYLADAEHDPQRVPIWTNAYVDPAGSGWIVSSIAPVYRGSTLEGVVGSDVRLTTLTDGVLDKLQPSNGFSILLDADGVIVAMPTEAESMFRASNAPKVDYARLVYEDEFKSDDFNVNLRPDTVELAAALASSPQGVGTVSIAGADVLVGWQTLEDPQWRVVTIVPDAAVRQIHGPGERLKHATIVTLWILLGGLLVMGVALALRARQFSVALTRPLEAIDEATAKIGAGEFEPVLPPSPVAELQRTADRLLATGRSLKEAQAQSELEAERLSESEARYRAIFDNVGAPVLTVGSDGRVIEANEAASKMFGRSLKGVDLGTVFPAGRWREPGHCIVEFNGPLQSRLMLELGIGSTGDGPDSVLTITARDITSQEQARELLEEAREMAERTSRLKDEFLASMSHEIRTPLNGVVGVLSLMADRPLPPEAQRDLEVARSSADDLLVLVNDVLDFAKIEADQVSLVLSDVRLASVIESVRQLYVPLAADQRDELTTSIDPGVPEWVRLDATRVRQVLANLVSNALKFTEAGTVHVRVGIETSEMDAGVGDARRGFNLRFEVSDTGMGIEPELQHRLFTRFAQGDPMKARRFPGTGLGLAIVKRLTEVMGGGVGMHSAPGRGSTFWFTVRAEAAVGGPAEFAGGVPAVLTDVPPMRVLVAEDNDVNRYLMMSMLERLGHQATAVVNGREAVEIAQVESFDLLLMDVQMPVANGIDATRAIRALPGDIARVPILAVTANVLPEQEAMYGDVGFSGYLPKPLTLYQLRVAIANVTGSSNTVEVVSEPETTVPERFNLSLIEEYRAVIGAEGARQMVDLFVGSLRERRAELAQASAADDLDGVRRAGHTIKGMAAAAGAARISEFGMRLQHAEWSEVGGLIAALDLESAEVVAELPGAWGLEQ